MSNTGAHTALYKTAVIILLLAFSLSPCAVKRDLLGIFDIRYGNTLNKTKTTGNSTIRCDLNLHRASSKILLSKADVKLKTEDFSCFLTPVISDKEQVSLNHHSKHRTGNSPPKYILFKRLKLPLL